MTVAIVANAVLGLALAAVVLTLLATAIRRSHVEHRLALAARRRRTRDHRRAPAHARTSWTANPDAS